LFIYLFISLLTCQESLSKIERRAEQSRREAEEQKEKTRQEKELKKRSGADQDVSLEEDEGPQPNPSLEAGKSLPRRFGDFPKELYGKPVDELDDFYDDKYVRFHDLFLDYFFCIFGVKDLIA